MVLQHDSGGVYEYTTSEHGSCKIDGWLNGIVFAEGLEIPHARSVDILISGCIRYETDDSQPILDTAQSLHLLSSLDVLATPV